ncbi:hypothetical protein CR956_01925 [Candidatus Saccharibacteria bacterium]|nr:MAG: hypothetical protein CR956_01925 [Candidatus Saccharibacteria bacterium]
MSTANKTICKDVFGNQFEVSTKDLNIRVGVYAVILSDNKILLTRQWNGYSIPGGGVEKGETIEMAFVREVKEETGLKAVPGSVIHQTTTFFKKDADSPAYQSHQFYVTAKSFSGDIKNHQLTDSEKNYTDDIPEWVSLDEIGNIKWRHSIDLREIIDKYNQKEDK